MDRRSKMSQGESIELSALKKEALCLLQVGIEHENSGAFMKALDFYERANALAPELAQIHYHRGNVLVDLGRAEDALGAFDMALERRPDWAECLFNRGNVCVGLGRYGEAEMSCRRALELKPGFFDALVVLGVAQEAQMRSGEAVASYRRALEIKPDHVGVNANLAGALLATGEPERAVECFFRALDGDPANIGVSKTLTTLLRDLGRIDESEGVCRRALEVFPQNVDLLNELGMTLMRAGKLAHSEDWFRRALKQDSSNMVSLHNLGAVLQMQKKYEEAVAVYRQALEAYPENVGMLSNLGLLSVEMGMLDSAVECFDQIMGISSDPKVYAEALSNRLFSRNYMSGGYMAELSLLEARQYGEFIARQATPFSEWQCAPDVGRTLRIGLVSGDLRRHPVTFFLEKVLAALVERAASRIEIVAYPTFHLTDEYSERIKACCIKWQPAWSLSDEALAKLIYEDRIDILIDLAGHTSHNRLPVFAWKAAPVQVSWLGYFATTGVSEIDYLIADPWTLPTSEEKYFTEIIWRLPETRLCFTAPDDMVAVSSLPALSQHFVTFGCFNSLSKMGDDVVELWGRILHAVPSSRLFLKSKQMDESSIREKVLERFAAQGIPEQRLILEGWSSRADYFASYHRVDIGLDPFPFTGGTTTVESLWMGVPVLTLAGQRFLSRQGVGMLMNAGLQGWVATNKDDYCAKAVAYANDLQQLALLRNRLRGMLSVSPILDAQRFSGYFEDALRSMWGLWCNKQKKAPSQYLKPNSLLGKLKKWAGQMQGKISAR